MAFILVQHLDPSHKSLLVELLAHHTGMTVTDATDGAILTGNHLYVIPPGKYLSVSGGKLHLTVPTVPHGSRLPIDFLLQSLAQDFGARAACVILSGTGADGSVGAQAIKAARGLVIVQDPSETAYDGMARSAIATGSVDHVLKIVDIPQALDEFYAASDRDTSDRVANETEPVTGSDPLASSPDWLGRVIDLIRSKTAHDFTLYKPGTLQRRIERRMALVSLKPGDIALYMAMLMDNPAELELLSTDLLINVTSFFRDKHVFKILVDRILPDILREHTGEDPIRVWVVGCSTGEEAYSLAIIFREQMSSVGSSARLQIFASDVDPRAVATAREGVYPASIADDVSEQRLARFFVREDDGYRVHPDLRSVIVFTVQDVLLDPPFSRLDLISCRNMLIYFGLEAQAKAIGMFHFALKSGGILLLGNSETTGNAEEAFEVVSKPARIYRHIGPASRLVSGLSATGMPGTRPTFRSPQGQAPSRATAIGEMARQRLLDAFGPPSALINRKNACVFTLGAVNRHLSVPPGYVTQDLYAMTDTGLHPKLRLAIQRATDEATRITIPAGRFQRGSEAWSLAISAEPVIFEAEELTLISFIETRLEDRKPVNAAALPEGVKIGEMELELAQLRSDLADSIRNLQMSGEEQKAINEEALSVNEEYQSTNEELLASKEELQSVNEELTALNTQLQETLDRQRTTSNDLQNVLYSTDVATLFLDLNLRIRFFTPSTKALFNVIPSDVGRPLADLHALAIDDMFLADAAAVIATQVPSEREVQAYAGTWYIRRILPYRTHLDGVEGVVVTFTDISDRKRAADALEAAKRQAQLADAAKSRFLAAASHDLRQPLQTLTLLQGLLAQTVEGEKATRLITRLDDTLGSMTMTLNTLLDINQIEAGTISVEIEHFSVDALLRRLRDEFVYAAEAQGLAFRVVASRLEIDSDPRLIEQMIRNILSNALKYTRTGKILLGCRRHHGHIRIEVWDTGLGIKQSELQSIFEEYHQIDNAARERSKGLGLGLAIVKRLGDLLGHTVSVRSTPGKGSVFAIDVPVSDIKRASGVPAIPDASGTTQTGAPSPSGTILVIEDEPEIRMLLESLLTTDGYRVATAADGLEAIDMITRQLIRPDLILADFNLPKGMTGLEVAAKARHILHKHLPAVILSGDISLETLADIAAQGCAQLAKPVKLGELRQAIQRKLTIWREATPPAAKTRTDSRALMSGPVVFIVDDDDTLRQTLRELLEGEGRTVEDFSSCEAFIAAFHPGREACLLIDATLPGMSGLNLLRHLKAEGHLLPAIMITGNGDIAIAVDAMKAGAADFIEKPVGRSALVACVDRALLIARDGQQISEWHEAAISNLADLTPRQHQIMDMILAGHPNKNIAADLGISQRTVENHRAAIMKRTGATSLPELARIAVLAGPTRSTQSPGGHA
jgi:two-component system CheB/CheR fusion protein